MGKLLFLSIFLFSAVKAAEKSGMPQLDTEFWVSQIFWLAITFSILLVLLTKFILPKISANLETRKSLILENISSAEKKRKESELKIKEYSAIIEKSKSEAKSLIKHAKEILRKDINLKKKALEKDLSNEIKKAETEIQELRDKAPEIISKIAVETSTDLLNQLISVKINSSSVSSIVNDIASRKTVKYYGN